MDYIVLIGLTSSICTILDFFTSKWFKSHLWIGSVVVFLLTSASGYIVHKNSELERIKDIHRQAQRIEEHYKTYNAYNEEFIQESLIFLEENKDKYPYAYERARKIYQDKENAGSGYVIDAAEKLHGIIIGIATLNKE